MASTATVRAFLTVFGDDLHYTAELRIETVNGDIGPANHFNVRWNVGRDPVQVEIAQWRKTAAELAFTVGRNQGVACCPAEILTPLRVIPFVHRLTAGAPSFEASFRLLYRFSYGSFVTL